MQLFPYVVMAYAMVLWIPYLWWSSVYENEIYEQLQFVMAGLEEALTMTIHAIAKMTDKDRRAENAEKDFTIVNYIRNYLNEDENKKSKGRSGAKE